MFQRLLDILQIALKVLLAVFVAANLLLTLQFPLLRLVSNILELVDKWAEDLQVECGLEVILY